MQTICIAVVGLRFGAAFPPIYRDHPDVERVAICDQNEAVLNAYGEQASLEWHRENEQPIITTMRPFNSAKAWSSDLKSVLAEPTDRLDLLPESIRRFTELVTIPDPKNPHQSISQGGRPPWLAPAHGPRIRPQHHRKPQALDRRHHRRQLDRGRDLRSRIGGEGRRGRRDPLF